MPCLRTGTLCCNHGITVDRYTNTRHQIETNANWTIVSVIGIGKAFRMDLEDVFVRAEVKYHTRQRAYG